MCLVAFAWQLDPEMPLLLLANRDEFFERPSAALAPWSQSPALLAGRDLRAGGTWLGFNRNNRRLAVITNVRELDAPSPPSPRSRGALIPEFLLGEAGPRDFARGLAAQGESRYEGFNLLLFEGDEGWWVSNRGGALPLEPGVHGLSNAALNTPWPKLERVRNGLSQGLQAGYPIEQLEDIFRRREREADADLPSTGVSLAWERKLSAVCIDGDPLYGTRALTSVRLWRDGEASLREWSRQQLGDDWSLVEHRV